MMEQQILSDITYADVWLVDTPFSKVNFFCHVKQST
jgi:hypothetical protein